MRHMLTIFTMSAWHAGARRGPEVQTGPADGAPAGADALQADLGAAPHLGEETLQGDQGAHTCSQPTLHDKFCCGRGRKLFLVLFRVWDLRALKVYQACQSCSDVFAPELPSASMPVRFSDLFLK